MQETLELIIIYIRDIWRYRWYAMAVVWLAVPVGWFAVSLKPITYTASAKIYVDTVTVLQPFLKGIVIDTEDSGAAYLGLMTRQLVSRPNLEQVASLIEQKEDQEEISSVQEEIQEEISSVQEEISSVQEEISPELENLLANLERKVQVQGDRASEKAKQSDFYTISYPNTSPELAKQVVDALLVTFEKNTVEESQRHYKKVKQFLKQQIQEQKEKLDTAEINIGEFKRENADALPEQGMNFFQRLQSAQAAVDQVDLEITEAEHRRRELQRQLAQVSPTQRAISADGNPVLTPLASRLLALQTRLDELLLKYTEQYPDVIATRHSIAELEKQLSTDKTPVMSNPVYQTLDASLGQVENEIAVLQARKNEYQHRVQTLREQIETLTAVETKLQRLNQDYDTAKRKYDELVGREAEVTLTIGQNEKNQRFRRIDPTRILETRAAVKRYQLMLAGGVLLASIAGGLAVAFFLAQIRPVVYGRRALIELTELPVFGSLSRAPTRQFRMRRFFNLAAFTMMGMIIVSAHGTAVYLQMNNIGIEEALNTIGIENATQILEGIIG